MKGNSGMPEKADGLVPSAGQALTAQAENDAQVIGMWLHGRSPHTQRAYSSDSAEFLSLAEKPLGLVTLSDLQGYADSLQTLSPSSQARKLSALKSLLSFAHRIGYLQFNVGVALKVPGQKNTLAERILSASDVQTMMALEPNRRNQVLLRTLYALGGRVSEVCALKWKDLQERNDAGQVTLYGKGNRTRVALLSADTWRELTSLRDDSDPGDPVFRSRKQGGHLHPSQVKRIVATAAKRAGIAGNVSPHWLRHAHASHALDRGCPIHLVQATLGHASVSTTGRYLHARPGDSSSRYLGV